MYQCTYYQACSAKGACRSSRKFYAGHPQSAAVSVLASKSERVGMRDHQVAGLCAWRPQGPKTYPRPALGGRCAFEGYPRRARHQGRRPPARK